MSHRFPVICSIVFALVSLAAAEEGMWLFNHPPTDNIKAKYGFELSQAWLDHTRLSSVRFNNSGAGAFVSPNGLVLANHRVALRCLTRLSKEGQDLYKTGFYAKSREEEAKCPDLELNQLIGIEDVTAKVNAGITPTTAAADVAASQRRNVAQVQADCNKTSGLRCDSVALYANSQFHLYKYKRFTDVRLVFAPEFDIAFFGGAPDNFEYPRYDLDIAFFRAYENGSPVKSDNYFKVTTAGVKENQLVFVSGHPGLTGRLNTLAQIEYLRDVSYPTMIRSYTHRINALKEWGKQSEDNRRRVQETIYSLETLQNAITGHYMMMTDDSFMNSKAIAEKEIRAAVQNDSRKKAEFGDPWADMASAMKVQADTFLPLYYFERLGGFGGNLPSAARTIVRAAAERQKPDEERLPEFSDSRLPAVEQSLLSGNAVYKDLDTIQLADSLAEMSEKMPDDPLVKQILYGRTPEEAAKQMIALSKLDDVNVRKALFGGGEKAVSESTDPLIVVMRLIDSESRRVRKQYEVQVDSVERASGAKIAQILFAQQGYNMPPDATSTLRLSYGTVKGYVEDGRGIAKKGEKIPYFTTIGGAFDWAAKHDSKPPYSLPSTWTRVKSRLNLDTAFTFVSTPDILTGGNSGSPVLNKDEEIVGVVFGVNIQALPWRFQYEGRIGRAVSVDSRAIIEALRSVYGASALADELVPPNRNVADVKDGKKAAETTAALPSETKKK